jgi:hypothetical protein
VFGKFRQSVKKPGGEKVAICGLNEKPINVTKSRKTSISFFMLC